MYHFKKITEDMYYVGGNDRRLALFENAFPIPRGISYNSYFIDDEKTVLLDTVDKAIANLLFENLNKLLDGRALDYVIVNHMEPDHCASLGQLIERYPSVKVVGNSKTIGLIKRFFDFDIDQRAVIVGEGETLCTGRHTFAFYMAPMVHWPEVMVTYDTVDKVLYSADAFGSFGAINGNIFDDQVSLDTEWMPDLRRYYTNIVGKYGVQVRSLLAKTANLEVAMICPLHGLIWRSKIEQVIEKYTCWSNYQPEMNSVLIAYGSIYGNTAQAAEILATKLAERGVREIAIYDVSATHGSVLLSEAFRYSTIVFAAPTYNMEIFKNMHTLLIDLKAHNLQNRTVALIENGSWSPVSAGKMREIISGMKNMTVLDSVITVESTLKEAQLESLDALADALAANVNGKEN